MLCVVVYRHSTAAIYNSYIQSILTRMDTEEKLTICQFASCTHLKVKEHAVASVDY